MWWEAPLPGKQIMYLYPCRSGDCSCHNEAYSTQLIAGYCLAVQFALVRGCISQGRYQDLISQLQCLPEQIQKILDDKERIQWFAAKQANARDVFSSDVDLIMPSAWKAA